jgi:hypothetical protein
MIPYSTIPKTPAPATTARLTAAGRSSMCPFNEEPRTRVPRSCDLARPSSFIPPWKRSLGGAVDRLIE